PGRCTKEWKVFVDLKTCVDNGTDIIAEFIYTQNFLPTEISELKIKFTDTLGTQIPDIDINSPGTNWRIAKSNAGLPYTLNLEFTLTTTEGCKYTIRGASINTYIGENASTYSCQGQGEFSGFSEDKEDPKYKDNSLTTCVRDGVYVTGNSIMSKENRFTYSLNNLYRERSVFFENYPDEDKNPIFFPLNHGIDQYLTDPKEYNGSIENRSLLAANGTCDASFLGTGLHHEYPIFNASGHYVTLLRHMPAQHGQLENLQYAELYTLNETETICGQVVKPIGVNYIGLFSVKRHAFVSDSVGSDVVPGNWIQNIFGIINCGELPKELDVRDRRLRDAMRDFFWDGSTPFPGFTGRFKFFPALLSANVTFFVESRVNIHMHELGDENEPINEVIYPHLKSLAIDAAFPEDSNPRKTWFNKFRFEM